MFLNPLNFSHQLSHPFELNDGVLVAQFWLEKNICVVFSELTAKWNPHVSRCDYICVISSVK